MIIIIAQLENSIKARSSRAQSLPAANRLVKQNDGRGSLREAARREKLQLKNITTAREAAKALGWRAGNHRREAVGGR